MTIYGSREAMRHNLVIFRLKSPQNIICLPQDFWLRRFATRFFVKGTCTSRGIHETNLKIAWPPTHFLFATRCEIAKWFFKPF